MTGKRRIEETAPTGRHALVRLPPDEPSIKRTKTKDDRPVFDLFSYLQSQRQRLQAPYPHPSSVPTISSPKAANAHSSPLPKSFPDIPECLTPHFETTDAAPTPASHANDHMPDDLNKFSGVVNGHNKPPVGEADQDTEGDEDSINMEGDEESVKGDAVPQERSSAHGGSFRFREGEGDNAILLQVVSEKSMEGDGGSAAGDTGTEEHSFACGDIKSGYNSNGGSSETKAQSSWTTPEDPDGVLSGGVDDLSAHSFEAGLKERKYEANSEMNQRGHEEGREDIHGTNQGRCLPSEAMDENQHDTEEGDEIHSMTSDDDMTGQRLDDNVEILGGGLSKHAEGVVEDEGMEAAGLGTGDEESASSMAVSSLH